jgi:hypothetical protein
MMKKSKETIETERLIIEAIRAERLMKFWGDPNEKNVNKEPFSGASIRCKFNYSLPPRN